MHDDRPPILIGLVSMNTTTPWARSSAVAASDLQGRA
jgi:hypothetical protein